MIDLTKRVSTLTGLLCGLDDKVCRSLIAAEIAVCDRILASLRDNEESSADDRAKLERLQTTRQRVCFVYWLGQLQGRTCD